MKINTQTRLEIYVPIELIGIDVADIRQSIDTAKANLMKIEGRLHLLEPQSIGFWKGHTVRVIYPTNKINDMIQQLESIQAEIKCLDDGFSLSMKGLERAFSSDIQPVCDLIIKLNIVCEKYLQKYKQDLTLNKKVYPII